MSELFMGRSVLAAEKMSLVVLKFNALSFEWLRVGFIASYFITIKFQWNETCYSTCPDPFLPPRSGKGSAKVWLARLI